MKMQALVLLTQDAIYEVAKGTVEIRDHLYEKAIRSPIGPVIKRIIKFVDDNSTLIFWGGALFFFCTHPPLFLASFSMGVVGASMVCYGAASMRKMDFSALRQTGKGLAIAINHLIQMESRCFFAGFSPGYHVYNLIKGNCYAGNIKGFQAIKQEMDRLCWELAGWVPLLDRAHHPGLHAPPRLP